MSQYFTLLQEAQTLLLAQPAFTGFTSDIRERPYFSAEHGDTLPFLCISGTKEEVEGLSMGQGGESFQVAVRYPIYVCAFLQRGTAPANSTAMAQLYDLREQAQVLWRARVLQASQRYAEYDPDPPFDLAGLDETFLVSLQLFTFLNDEVRT